VVADIQARPRPDQQSTATTRERQATVAADLVGSAALGDATKKIYELPVMKKPAERCQGQPFGRCRKA